MLPQELLVGFVTVATFWIVGARNPGAVTRMSSAHGSAVGSTFSSGGAMRIMRSPNPRYTVSAFGDRVRDRGAVVRRDEGSDARGLCAMGVKVRVRQDGVIATITQFPRGRPRCRAFWIAGNLAAASRQELERVRMARPHDREVLPVERRDPCDLESLSQRDHRRVSRSQREVLIRGDELSGPELR